MALIPAPPIDRRKQQELADQLREFMVRYVAEYPDVDAVRNDPQVETIVQLFSRLHEIINDRLNRAPDRNFLTFLEMVGIEISPPKPAAAPLVFVPGTRASGDITVPAGTPVIVEGSEDDPITFETREDLTVVLAQMERIVSIDPAADRYWDHASLLDEDSALVETLLAGRTPLTHRIYFGHDSLFDIQDAAILRIISHQPVTYGFAPDNWQVAWYKYDAQGELEALSPLIDDPVVDTRVANLLQGGTLEFRNIKSIEPAAIQGYQRKVSGQQSWPVLESNKRWIVAELSTSIPTGTYTKALGLKPQLLYFNSIARDPGVAFFPFGTEPDLNDRLQIGDAAIFANTGATIVLEFTLSAPTAIPLPAGVSLDWQYRSGVSWITIATVSAAGASGVGPYNFEDTTEAFTRSGAVRFFCPEIPLSTVNDLESRWIRVRLSAGGYQDTGANYGPEVVQFSAGHTYIPELNRIQAQIEISPDQAKQAKFAFYNAQSLDVSKDFYPFGKKPEFGDAFYFALKDAFANVNAAIDISVTLSPGAPPPDTDSVALTFEYFDGAGWQIIGVTDQDGVPVPTGTYGFQDSTAAFTVSGNVRFVCPPMQAATVNGREDYFLRVRMTGGNYGREAIFDNDTATLLPATFAPPSIESLLIDYAFVRTGDPEQLIIENEFFFRDATADFEANAAALEGGGTPAPVRFFETSSQVAPALYIGFDRALNSVPVSLFFPILPAPFQLSASGEPPTILWEYWNGNEWKVATFNDGTLSLTRKDLAQVLVPGDSQVRPLFGTPHHWVRLRLESGQYVTKPQVSALYLNTVWSDNLVTVRGELLGSSSGEPDQIFRVSRTPVVAGQRVVVREPALTALDRETILAEAGADAIREETDEAGNVTAIWVRWHPVVRFEASGPQSRHYIFDALSGEIRFGNGARGFVPPAGRNNVVAEIYQYGGGSRGNVRSKVINKPRTALVGIDAIFNPENVAGGVDLESLDRLRQRGPRAIKNRGRAVTLDDFEALVIESTGEVARVRALGTTDPNLQTVPGWVTVLIVPDSDDPRPIPSQELIRYVGDFVRERGASHIVGTDPTQINVLPPNYVRVFAEVDVAYRNINEAKIVQARINEALTDFFNPLRGGPKGTGWEFGRNVYGTEVYQLVEDVEGVDFVKSVVLRAAEQIYYVFPRAPFRALAAYPAGSEIEFTRLTAGGTRRASYRIGEKVLEDETTERMTVLGVKEGDVVTLRTPATENNFPINLVVKSVSGSFLGINADFAQVVYPVGSTIESADGRVVTALLEAITVGEFDGLTVMVPEAGDEYRLRYSDLAQQTGELLAVSADVEVIILDANNLVYSGTHVIRAVQQEVAV